MLNKWHYLGRMVGVIAAFGHEEGCCVFTNLRSRILQTKLPGNPIELARMVGMPDHKWAMTSLMALCLRQVKIMGYTVCITYADPWNNNTGAVYRADNWIPWGETQADTVFLLDGKRISRRYLYDLHGTQSQSVMQKIYGERLHLEVAPPKKRFIKYL